MRERLQDRHFGSCSFFAEKVPGNGVLNLDGQFGYGLMLHLLYMTGGCKILYMYNSSTFFVMATSHSD